MRQPAVLVWALVGAWSLTACGEPAPSAPTSMPPGGAASMSGAGAGAGGSVTGGASGGPSAGATTGGASGGSVATAGTDSGGSPPSLKPLGKCALPSGAKLADLESAYAKWKAELVTADGAGGFLRVRRPNSGSVVNSSNSEGIAYGLELAAYMNDQPLFDALWQYQQLHRGKNGLMEWEIGPDGATIGGGAASDGDEDMALALVMAHKKWGGKGSLNDTYENYALQLIDLIWQHEVDQTRGDVFTPGDQFGGGAIINISYFAPAYYRVFGKFSGKSEQWQRVVESSYRVIAATLNATNRNVDNGLVPAWSTPEGVPMAPANTSHPTHHQLDSCRTPFRIAQDYCWFEEPRALDYLKKIGAFHAGIGAANIVEGYNLDGTVYPGATLNLAAFVGGAGVGAMAVPELGKLRDESYQLLAAWGPLLGGSLYYNQSWSVLSLAMMTGVFVEPTSL